MVKYEPIAKFLVLKAFNLCKLIPDMEKFKMQA